MPAAVIGGAIAGVGAIGAAAIGSSAQKKAANKAAQTAQDTTAANNALQMQIYNQNAAVLSPYISRGNQAGSMYGALLGLQPTNNAGTANVGQPSQAAPQSGISRLFAANDLWRGEPTGVLNYGYNALNGQYVPNNDTVMMAGTNMPVASTQSTTAQNYQQAFGNYKNSTGYHFRFDQGLKALDASASSRGVLNSGAALKSLARFGQGIASDEFGNYLGYLGNLMGTGLNAAGAQAGVSTNMANQVSANNNAASSALAAAALQRGNANAQFWGTTANALGNVFGSSFSPGGGSLNAASQRMIAANPGIF